MMRQTKILFQQYLHNDEGATAIEYGSIAALIGVGIIAGAKSMTGSINTLFTDVDSELVKAFK